MASAAPSLGGADEGGSGAAAAGPEKGRAEAWAAPRPGGQAVDGELQEDFVFPGLDTVCAAPDQATAGACDCRGALRAAMLYVLITMALSAGLFIVGFTVGVLPLTALAREGYSELHAAGGDGMSLAGDGWTPDMQDNLNKGPVIAFYFARYTTAAFSQSFIFWGVLCLGWQGWGMSKGVPLALALANAVGMLAAFAFSRLLFIFGVIDNSERTAIGASVWPISAIWLSAMFWATRPVGRSCSHMLRMFALVLVQYIGYILLYGLLERFFTTRGTVMRILIRCVFPSLLKRLWIHLNWSLSAGLHIKNESNRCLIFIHPLSFVAATSTCMQMGSENLVQALGLQVVALCFDVHDSLTLLCGVTPVEASVKPWLWCFRQGRKRFSSVFPVTASVPRQLTAVERAAMEREKEQKRTALATAAVYNCSSEAMCSGLFAAVFLLLPVNTSEVNPTSRKTDMLWLICALSLTGEFLGDALVGAISLALAARWPSRIVSAVQVKGKLKITVPRLVAVGCGLSSSLDSASLFLSNLCLSSAGHGGAGQQMLGLCNTTNF